MTKRGVSWFLLPIVSLVLLGGTSLARAESPETLYVNPQSGTDSPGAGGTASQAFRTITYALSQAQPGTVVQLAPGHYSSSTGEVFPLVVKPGVVLQGDPHHSQTVVITGGGTFISPTFADQNITILAQNASTINGLTVTDPESRGTGIWVESSSPLIENCTFVHNLREGIFVTGANANPRIYSNLFTHNDGNGISITQASAGEIKGNLFVNTGFGIAVGGTSNPLIVKNKIIQNRDGVLVSDQANPTLRDNVIEYNTQDGVIVIGNGLPDLGTATSPGHNLIQDNTLRDIYNASRGNTISALGDPLNPKKITGPVQFDLSEVTPTPKTKKVIVKTVIHHQTTVGPTKRVVKVKTVMYHPTPKVVVKKVIYHPTPGTTTVVVKKKVAPVLQPEP